MSVKDQPSRTVKPAAIYIEGPLRDMSGKVHAENTVPDGMLRVTLTNTGPCTVYIVRNGKQDVPLIVKDGVVDLDVSAIKEIEHFGSAGWSNFNGFAKIDLGAAVLVIEADKWP